MAERHMNMFDATVGKARYGVHCVIHLALRIDGGFLNFVIGAMRVPTLPTSSSSNLVLMAITSCIFPVQPRTTPPWLAT